MLIGIVSTSKFEDRGGPRRYVDDGPKS